MQNKFKQFSNAIAYIAFILHGFCTCVQRAFRGVEQRLKRMAQCMNIFTRDIAALQPNQIQPIKVCTLLFYGAKRNHIFFYARHAANKGIFTNAYKLVHRRQTTNDGAVTYFHMPSKGGVIS